ncbi:Archaellum assembly protein J, TadC family [Halanaeroarchaeum sp. HSR-CO]|uniref:type II secretion system F family protein n=1 Tax=Halanaeroarchaeum sp. HSR-CO TaxID=2866382 RepID=UPI00217E2E94|nr:type II secretion system F family protein [Halanaeroarchaeum sp. HSR-CO]UWG47185.1 Archaellum assembly protein J, TadC family [Halanaeroarchaeum sp. HSR-CO]
MSERSWTMLDGVLTLAFARNPNAPRTAHLRQLFRATTGSGDITVFLGRLYGLSWIAFALTAGIGYAFGQALPPVVDRRLVAGLSALPLLSPSFVEKVITPLLALGFGLLGKRATIRGAVVLLERRARRQRDRIERSLPRTVRYMHVLASGTTDVRSLIAQVAERERAFGETARAFQRIQGTASITGTVDDAIRIIARDTPSRQRLAPFLLTLRLRAREGPQALARFLHLESRMLARQDAQRAGTAKRYLGSVVQLFVVLLVLPAVAVVTVAVASGLSETTSLPAVETARWIRGQVLVSPVSALVVLVLGFGASGLVYVLRPAGYRWSRYRSSNTLWRVVATAHRNPANALVLLVPLGTVLVGWFASHGTPVYTALTTGYVLVALPVGLIEWRRAKRDAAKDRYLPAFLHEVAHQVHLGRSFTEAAEHVADDERLGPLDPDVADLAIDLRVAQNDRPVRGAALDRFVDRVGTPLAERTVGMIAGALDAGSQTAAAFEALQSEAGRLYHQERAVKDEMSLFLAIGWAASLLVVGIVVAVNVAALGTTVPVGGQTAALSGGPTRPPMFYLLTQATVLASGWFAGVAGRGVYEGLLHSGALVLVTFLAFAGSGLL